ncbi:Rhodanese/Cell cycle control phosphatase superfamily protein [Rhynchospora pubera]|uniref:Rhodanese/Cell cycle control phosphatase superfamily protein n=1 Tax=Rhynchospora pubera TaxID=906938 RepID=A0AAV8EIZ3_9POAL|nr:Rhodanese/Cell cycle control phosphatase superfamily protein [Rhynchospora pubera]
MEGKSMIESLTVDVIEARKVVASGRRYLDVRLPEVFEAGHVEGAINIPFYSSVTPEEKVKNPQFVQQVSELFGKDDEFIVACNSGVRSKLATLDLANAGFKNVKNMAGGYLAWKKAESEEALVGSNEAVI